MAEAASTPKRGYRSISQAEALRRFDYDPEKGDLIWKPDPSQNKVWNARWPGKVAGFARKDGVGHLTIGVPKIYAHRIVWAMHFGDIPIGMVIDHIDGDGANNRIANLRLVTVAQNMRNMRRAVTNKTGATGVRFRKETGVYIARGWLNGKMIHLGCSKDFETAVAIRKNWEREHDYHPNHGSVRS